MAQAKDTYVYKLMKGKNIVYIGISKDPERREKEHRKDKVFDSMVKISGPMTKEKAKEEEKKLLANYRKTNSKNPKLNKDSDG